MAVPTWAVVVLLLAGIAAAAFALDRGLRWLFAREWHPPRLEQKEITTAAGNVVTFFGDLFSPSVKNILLVKEQRRKQAEEDEGEKLRLLAELAALLGQAPVDVEAVRQRLKEAREAGLDWEEVYAEAFRRELEARPHRAPFLPPPARVAPPT